MKTFTLNITQEDIDKANEQRRGHKYDVCKQCVVAVALTRKFNCVCRAFLDCGDAFDGKSAMKNFSFPQKLKEYIRRFDDREKISPAKFRLTFTPL